MATVNRSATLSDTELSALRAKYDEEKQKRLNPLGLAQYVRADERYRNDPFMERVERAPVTDHVDFTVIGGGFSGLQTGAYAVERGIKDVRIIDTAGDFGGAWYWNRYPGLMCDSAAMAYLPMLEETGHMPGHRFTFGPEIQEHARRIGQKFGLYDRALFHTQVTSVAWDEKKTCWIVSTDRGDRFTTTFLSIGMGPLSVPKLPGIEGLDTFKGHTFHTSRWDYKYTGGNPAGAPMDKLRDKRVAVIGTGATAIQVVPALAKDAAELFVVQRTPIYVAPRDNAPTDAKWFADISSTPGWYDRFQRSYMDAWEGIFGRPGPEVEVEDLHADGFSQLALRIRDAIHSVPADQATPERIAAAVEADDFAHMNELRARIEAIVEDPETAEKLKPWYGRLCKRLGFHDEYLPAFNRKNVHLVDTDGQGVERLTENGFVVNGVEYAVDCIIFATGFSYSYDFLRGVGFDIVGSDGVTLKQAWSNGMRTLHGIYVHGFPNLFINQMAQAAFFGINHTSGSGFAARTIAAVAAHAVETGALRVEATEAGQSDWVEMLVRDGAAYFNADTNCTPGYYNDEGRAPTEADRLLVGYPAGSKAYFSLIEDWIAQGDYSGLAFEKPAAA